MLLLELGLGESRVWPSWLFWQAGPRPEIQQTIPCCFFSFNTEEKSQKQCFRPSLDSILYMGAGEAADYFLLKTRVSSHAVHNKIFPVSMMDVATRTFYAG